MANVQKGKPHVVGVDADAPSVVWIEIPLVPYPDTEWQAIFDAVPPGVSYSIAHGPPMISPPGVKIRCSEGDIEGSVNEARERVEGTNREYARTVIPRREAQLKRAQEMSQETAETMKRVQEKLDQLG